MTGFPTSASFPYPKTLLGLLLAFLTLAAFYPVLSCDFIVLDDSVYVSHNKKVLDGLTPTNVLWAWSTLKTGYFQPLTWMSLQLDATIFGPTAFGFHLTNLLMHTVNVVLLFFVLCRLTGSVGRSAVVAGLFAVHPLHVESVAWVTERKDVLSTLFGLGALWAYGEYASRPGVKSYLLVVLFLVLSLLTKPMLVTLPFALLLLDYWPLRRWGGAAGGPEMPAFAPAGLPRLLLEKVPLAILAAAASVLTFLAQEEGRVPLEYLSPIYRLANVLVGYEWYVQKTLFPFGLGVMYSHPMDRISLVEVMRALVVLGAITGLVLAFARRYPAPAVGWLWFLGTLFPVSGIVQSGPQAFADRFSYWPHIGLLVALVWALADLARAVEMTPAWKIGLAAVLLLGLGLRTADQASHWKNSLLLWDHTLRVTTDNYVAHNYLARELTALGQISDAQLHLEEAVRIKDNYADAHHRLGVVLLRQGDLAKAREHFHLALDHSTMASADPHHNLGFIYLSEGDLDKALVHFQKALEIVDELPDTYLNLGILYWQKGNREEALKQFRKAEELKPESPQVQHQLGQYFLKVGQLDQARKHLEKALRDPEPMPDVHLLLGVLQGRQKDWTAAELQFRKASSLRPDSPIYLGYLGQALGQQGHKEEAKKAYQLAMARKATWPKEAAAQALAWATDPDQLKREPKDALDVATQVCEATNHRQADGLEALAAALAENGQFPQAVETAREALKLADQPEMRQRLQDALTHYEMGKAWRGGSR